MSTFAKKTKNLLDKIVDYVDDITNNPLMGARFRKARRERDNQRIRDYVSWCEDMNPFLLCLLVIGAFVLLGVSFALAATIF